MGNHCNHGKPKKSHEITATCDTILLTEVLTFLTHKWHTNVNRDRNRFSQFPCPVFLTSPMYFPMFCSMFSYVFPMITRFTRFTGMLAVALEDLRRLCGGTKHHRGRRPWPETQRWSWRAEVVAFSPKDCENPKETYPLKSLIPIIKKTDNKGPNPYTNHS